MLGSEQRGASAGLGASEARAGTMEGAASWRRLLEVKGDIDAAEVLDSVLNPLVNVSTTDEAREDAFHDKVIRVRPARDAPWTTRRRSRADP